MLLIQLIPNLSEGFRSYRTVSLMVCTGGRSTIPTPTALLVRTMHILPRLWRINSERKDFESVAIDRRTSASGIYQINNKKKRTKISNVVFCFIPF